MVGIDAAAARESAAGPPRSLVGSDTVLRPGRHGTVMGSSDSYSVDPADIEPIGATIAVAFTGAAIGLVGAAVSFVALDLGIALVGVGVVVALSSPLAYVRMKRLRGE